jgi:hypothetical protein
MDKITALKECVDKIAKDAYKFFEKNNKAAGVRTRKKLQKCKKYAQEIRNLIQKSKHEHVQKKAALTANTAALSVDKFINNTHNKENLASGGPNKNSSRNNSNFVFSEENRIIQPFLNENIKNFDVSKSLSGFQGYNRIESLPSLSGNDVDVLR